MVTLDATRLAECRRLVSSVLECRRTPQSHRGIFRDDVVYFAARALEEHDAFWLLAEVRDRRHPLAGRRNLVMWGLGRYQAEMWSELRSEDPTVPVYPCSR